MLYEKKIELTKFLNGGRNDIKNLNKNDDGIISSLEDLNKYGRKFFERILNFQSLIVDHCS